MCFFWSLCTSGRQDFIGLFHVFCFFFQSNCCSDDTTRTYFSWTLPTRVPEAHSFAGVSSCRGTREGGHAGKRLWAAAQRRRTTRAPAGACDPASFNPVETHQKLGGCPPFASCGIIPVGPVLRGLSRLTELSGHLMLRCGKEEPEMQTSPQFGENGALLER